VDEHRLLGAVPPRLVRDGGDVRLVVLAEVGRERERDRPLLAHPRERAARVEPARERDPDALADRQRREDDAAVRVHCPAPSWPSCSASSAASPALRTATKIVLSPATVPATSGRRASSIASASAAAKPRGVWITSSWPVGAKSSAHVRSAVASWARRRRSAAPGSA